MEQLMEITSPFGDAVRFETMQAREELGRLAEYDITVLSAKETLLPKDILGQGVTVIHNGLEAGPRHFNACVTRFGLVGVEGRYFRYRIVAHTWLWLLTRSADCRIFQNKSVPDIVREIFGKYPDASFDFRLTGSYPSLDYCVQYRESDFDFISRLLETEGIYYFLKHAPGKHTVVLCDSISAHKPVVGHASIRFLPEGGRGRAENKTIGEWMSAREIRTGMTELDDYDFERPSLEPIVQGPQTAIVVGPAGDEIYTDKYGRVKVQFHWDRYGKKDQNSSCWIRVSHPWAGQNWGMIAIPRIGQEVIVEFLEGDPDRPIITGRVYNADQMPPYALPANMTQTGIKTRSTKGGGVANFNEIRFEDKKGAEQVYIHAEPCSSHPPMCCCSVARWRLRARYRAWTLPCASAPLAGACVFSANVSGSGRAKAGGPALPSPSRACPCAGSWPLAGSPGLSQTIRPNASCAIR
jgi:uncharacterized protein involved in type VI secretion and phage assembly